MLNEKLILRCIVVVEICEFWTLQKIIDWVMVMENKSSLYVSNQNKNESYSYIQPIIRKRFLLTLYMNSYIKQIKYKWKKMENLLQIPGICLQHRLIDLNLFEYKNYEKVVFLCTLHVICLRFYVLYCTYTYIQLYHIGRMFYFSQFRSIKQLFNFFTQLYSISNNFSIWIP